MKNAHPTIESIAFCLQQAPGVGPATLRALLSRLAHDRVSAADFLQHDDRILEQRYGLKPPAISALRKPAASSIELWNSLDHRGVKLLVLGHPEYPGHLMDVLGNAAPALLYAWGNIDILRRPSVGFCGSRKASEQGIQVATECARLMAREGFNVISGYAQGVDIAAHRAALEAGGATTVVLAEGILNFRIKSEIRDMIDQNDPSKLLVISEFPPDLHWLARNAMMRNRTICGLSNAMVVIEAGLEGGTFEAGKAALDLHVPLFCVQYAEPAPSAAGNPYFLQHGAIGLQRARTGPQNLSQLVSAARNAGAFTYQMKHQTELILNDK